MKQKKTKLPFATETVRSLSRSLEEIELRAVAGGLTTSIIVTKCANSGGCNG